MFHRSFFIAALSTLALCSSCQKQKSTTNPSGAATTAPFTVTVTRIAGDDTQFGAIDNADGLKARFSFPKKIVWDHRNSCLYVAENPGAGRLRKIAADGRVSTPLPFVGTSEDIFDLSLAPGAAGTLYYGTSARLEKLTEGGMPQFIIDWKRSNGSRKTGNEVGSLDNAAVSGPHGIGIAPNGVIYFANSWYLTVHRVDLGAVGNEVSEFAGKPTTGVSAGAFEFANGQGNAATFGTIADIAVDVSGNVYVADGGYCTVRKISPQGMVTSFLIQTSNTFNFYIDKDGPLAAARSGRVSNVATSGDGSLIFFASPGAVRLLRPGNDVTTLATFGNGVSGLACTPDGKTVYVTSGHAVYKIDLK